MHFPVYVLVSGNTENIEQTISDLMAPYQDNNMGTCPKKYLEFWDQDADFRKQYEEDTCKRLRFGKEGPLEDPNDEKFLVYLPPPPPSDLLPPIQACYSSIPAGYEEVDVPIKDVYPSFDAFMEQRADRHPETGKYGYWMNPNARWDYWLIGDRWTGVFEPTYDLHNNPRNFEPCKDCHGTGHLADVPEHERIADNTTSQCKTCEGKGEQLKWILPVYDGDFALVSKVLAMKEEDLYLPCAIVTSTGKWIEAPTDAWWAEKGDTNPAIRKWRKHVQKVLKEHEAFIVVVLDCHM